MSKARHSSSSDSAVKEGDEMRRPTWLFGKTVHEGCDRAGYYDQSDFTQEERLFGNRSKNS